LLLTRKILIKVIALLCLCNTTRSQNLLFGNKAGFNLAANVAIGTHIDRLGFNLNFFATESALQYNAGLRVYYNFRTFGPKKIHPEVVLSQGLLVGYGARTKLFNPFISSVSNQTGYQSSVAYSYNVYLNRQLTTQPTGIIALEFNRFSIISENDLFARPFYDRFRTAAFLLQYQYQDQFQAAINCTMWTGKMGVKKGIENPDFNFGCYMDTTGAVYRKTSGGMLSAQFRYNAGYLQNVQANVGVDAEQIRNAVQNKFIHDMRFIPKKWNKSHNCHLPMLDEQGEQYLFRPGQKIRKPRPYLNLYANANVFY
jgi:hypothetical protein